MKTKTIVTDITKEDLSDLFCCASEGSPFAGFLYKISDYRGTELEDENDFMCDICAKLLLAGKTIYFADYYAEDSSEHYGNLPHSYSETRCCMKYALTLEDIKNGIGRALDLSGDDKDSHVRGYANILCSPDRIDLDLTSAETLMQFIVFGEVIYG